MTGFNISKQKFISATKLIQDPQYQILHGEIVFSFDLSIEWLYLGKIKSQARLPPLIGFRLHKENESLSFYIQKEKIIFQVQKYLSPLLLQQNIHHFYKLVRKIGKGGFASVFLVQNIIEGKYYAAKIFVKQNQKNKENLISIQNEIATLRLISHQNLLKLKETFVTQNSIYLITEYCSGPTLEGYLQHNNYSLTKSQIRQLMEQQLEGLEYLHSLGIMHRDLKPANILFTSNECQNLVIADFGLAQEVASGNYLFPRAGTPGYVAPEVANNIEKLSNYSELCDMFSMGCIFYLMVTGSRLFQGKVLQEILAANKKCQIDFESEQFCKIDPEIAEVLIALLRANPQERVSAKEILQLPLFSKKEPKNLFRETNSSKTNSSQSIDQLTKLVDKVQIDYLKQDLQKEESTKFLNRIEQQSNQINIEQFYQS